MQVKLTAIEAGSGANLMNAEKLLQSTDRLLKGRQGPVGWRGLSNGRPSRVAEMVSTLWGRGFSSLTMSAA